MAHRLILKLFEEIQHTTESQLACIKLLGTQVNTLKNKILTQSERIEALESEVTRLAGESSPAAG